MKPHSTTSLPYTTLFRSKLTVQAGGLAINQAVSTGAGDLTLNVVGPVTQTASGTITGTGLALLGSGTVNLDTANNNVATISASYTGTIRYLDVNSLTVGRVTDPAMTPNTTTSGISSTGNDVKLTVQAAGFAINPPALHDALPISLNVVGPVTQTASGIITGTGLQILGSGTVNLDVAANNVATISASYTG